MGLKSDSQVFNPQDQSLVQDDQHQQGTLALEDSYADENYDYGQYEEGYDDGSGLTIGGMGTDANKGKVCSILHH